MLSLRIEPQYNGVSLIEMESLLGESDEPIEVKWGNTKRELDLLRPLTERTVVLVVENMAAMERAATTLGLKFLIQTSLVLKASTALGTPEGQWREFAQQNGHQVARGVVLRAVAQASRNTGVGNAHLRKVLVESLFDHTSPLDTDILYGLRAKGARV